MIHRFTAFPSLYEYLDIGKNREMISLLEVIVVMKIENHSMEYFYCLQYV